MKYGVSCDTDAEPQVLLHVISPGSSPQPSKAVTKEYLRPPAGCMPLVQMASIVAEPWCQMHSGGWHVFELLMLIIAAQTLVHADGTNGRPYLTLAYCQSSNDLRFEERNV